MQVEAVMSSVAPVTAPGSGASAVQGPGSTPSPAAGLAGAGAAARRASSGEGSGSPSGAADTSSGVAASPGGDGVELSSEAAEVEPHGAGEGEAPFHLDPSRGERRAERARARALRESLKSGEPVRFKSSQGEVFEVQVSERYDEALGGRTFTIAFDGYELEVNMEEGIKPGLALARITDAISRYPPHLRADLKAVHLHQGANPNGPPAAAWVDAISQSGVIHFQHGTQYLNEEVFDHEMGHVVGDFVEDRQASPEERAEEAAHGWTEFDPGKEYVIPEGWIEAIEGDDRPVSEYGETNHAEDFAEFWDAYMDAVEGGPRALDFLARRYPHRFRIADSIYRDEDYTAASPPPPGVLAGPPPDLPWSRSGA